MYEAMALLNRSASETEQGDQSSVLYDYTFRLTGEGGGADNGLGNRPFMPEFAIPPLFRDAVTKLLDEQFGPGRAQLRSMASSGPKPQTNTTSFSFVKSRRIPIPIRTTAFFS